MAVYIAANAPLPLIAWDADHPALHVAELNGEFEEQVRQQFSKPYVYYAGAHTYCGCGFAYGRYEGDEAPEATQLSQQSVAQLAAYLAQAIAQHGPLELFACWEGDQAAPPALRGTITPAAIGGERFWFEEKQFLVVAAVGLLEP